MLNFSELLPFAHKRPKDAGKPQQSQDEGRDTFLGRLSEQNQTNLENLSGEFKRYLEERGIKGAMIVVGGILEKPLPRKDIDIRVILETGKTRKDYRSELDYANDKFTMMRELATRFVRNDSEIGEVIEPAIDEEFQNPSILKHEGSIQIIRPGATPVELLNTIRGTVASEIGKQTRPFVVLVRTV